MNRVAYADVLRGVAQLTGFVGNAAELALPLGEGRRMRDAISRRLEMGLEAEFWPEWMVLEERRWTTNVFGLATTYTPGTFVWYPATDTYYQALVGPTFSGQAPADSEGEVNAAYWIEAQFSTPAAEAWDSTEVYVQGEMAISPVNGSVYVVHAATSLGNEPSATGGEWGLVSVLERTVIYEQTGKTAIGTVEGVWDLDPRKNRMAKELEFLLTAEGVTVLPAVGLGSSVWMRIRKRAPILFGEAFDATAVYAVGDQVFYGSDTAGAGSYRGDFFDCVTATTAGQSPLTHAAKWTRVEIPARLRRYLERGGASEYMRGEGEGPVLEGEAQAELMAQVMKFRGEEQQTRRTRVLTR